MIDLETWRKTTWIKLIFKPIWCLIAFTLQLYFILLFIIYLIENI